MGWIHAERTDVDLGTGRQGAGGREAGRDAVDEDDEACGCGEVAVVLEVLRRRGGRVGEGVHTSAGRRGGGPPSAPSYLLPSAPEGAERGRSIPPNHTTPHNLTEIPTQKNMRNDVAEPTRAHVEFMME